MTSPPAENPFMHPSPEESRGDATLTPQERKIYEFIARHRDSPPSFMDLFLRNVPRWVVLAASTVLGLAVFVALDLFVLARPESDHSMLPYIVVGLLAMVAGSIFRDIGQISLTRKLWMVEMRVIDFRRVERLLWGDPDAPLPRDRDEPLAAIPVDDGPARRD